MFKVNLKKKIFSFQKDGKEEVDEAFKAKRDKFSDFDAARKASKAKDSTASNSGSTSKAEKDAKDSKEKKDKDGMALGAEANDMDEDENKETVVEDCLPPFCMSKYEHLYLKKIEH